MLELKNVSKKFGFQVILEEVDYLSFFVIFWSRIKVKLF